MNISDCWQKLKQVQSLVFKAESAPGGMGWNGRGEGLVDVSIAGNEIVFREYGAWTTSEGKELPFKNVFRWTFNEEQNAIGLEHLRFGPDNPVFLFQLLPVAGQGLESVEPHLCAEDIYAGRLRVEDKGICLVWTIEGPKKKERIEYWYS